MATATAPAPTAGPSVSATCSWDVRMLGGLRARGGAGGAEEVSRFRTHKGAALLARLALPAGRMHSREELAELLWPESDEATARMSLRSSLSALRHLLEGPGLAEPGSVLQADGRTHVCLAGEAVTTDVYRFESALRRAQAAAGAPEREAAYLAEAVAAYAGPLLPGFYEDWVLSERERLALLYRRALLRLSSLRSAAGADAEAVDLAMRAVSEDPLDEDSQAALIGLHARAGRRDVAERLLADYARVLDEQLGDTPSAAIRRLVGVAPTPCPSPAAGEGSREGAAPFPSSSPLPSRSDKEGEGPGERAPGPPAEGAAPAPTNLPTFVTRFFGREDEIARLRSLLAGDAAPARLVTLTGPGGTGKTRLAVEAARSLAAEPGLLPGGVWFAPLADLRDPALLPDALARAVGAALPPRAAGAAGTALDDLVALAAQRLGGRPALLILDNAEHLLTDDPAARALAPDVADAAHALLMGVPSLSLLVTSRRPLLIEGEQESPVAPLPVPRDVSAAPDPLLSVPSVALFVARARAARADFSLTPRNSAAVAALCRRLEGVPLAIELAAAWAQVYSPQQMLERLKASGAASLDLLVTRRAGAASAEGRHATLRNAIRWSYDLLPDDARRLLAELSVFRGGWDLEAAEAVCRAAEPIDGLTLLRERSLIVAEFPEEDGSGDEGLRYRMLESLREFAQERLAEAGADADGVRDRHLGHYLGLSLAAEPHLRGPEQARWLARLAREHDNLRAALDWCAGEGAPVGRVEAGLRLTGVLWRYWEPAGHLREGRERIEALLERAGDAPEGRDAARARVGAGNLARGLGDFAAARGHLTHALETARAAGDRALEAVALGNLGNAALLSDDFPGARSFYTQALEAAEAIGDRAGQATHLTNLGLLFYRTGDYALSREYTGRALGLNRALGSKGGEAANLINLGYAALWQGDPAAARPYFEQGLALHREIGNRVEEAADLRALGAAAVRAGDHAAAVTALGEALALYREMGNPPGEANVLSTLGAAYAEAGEHKAAARHAAESLELHRHMGSRIGEAVDLGTLGKAALLRGDAASALRVSLEGLEIFREIGYRVGEADMLFQAGRAALALGDGRAARAHFAASLPLRRELGDEKAVAATEAALAEAGG